MGPNPTEPQRTPSVSVRSLPRRNIFSIEISLLSLLVMLGKYLVVWLHSIGMMKGS